jgi:hypothetical protein
VKRADEVDATVGCWPIVKVGSAMWILFASLAVIVAGTYLGFDLGKWFRSAPLRREWKARAVTFRTELSWVRIPPDDETSRMELIVQVEQLT